MKLCLVEYKVDVFFILDKLEWTLRWIFATFVNGNRDCIAMLLLLLLYPCFKFKIVMQFIT